MADCSIYHNVPVIQQGKANSCWYTCLQMITRYCRAQGKSADLIDLADDTVLKGWFILNKGLPNEDAVRYTKKLGYDYSAMSPTLDGLAKLLKTSPIIYAGMWDEQKGHWVIINGISEKKVSLIDPLHGRMFYEWSDLINGELKQDSDLPFFYPKP